MAESINKVELQGPIYGLKQQNCGSYKMYNFILTTSYEYKSKDGSMYSELTHHNVQALDPEVEGELENQKCVHLIGRLRHNKYLDSEGKERVITSVVASKIKVLN